MKNNITKIRAALEMARDYITSDLASERGAFEGYEGVSRIGEIKADLANNDEALAALAELEKAAAEPVAWVIGKPTHGHEIGRYLAWNAGHVPHSVGSAAEPLYAAPPAPVSEIREVVVTDEIAEKIHDSICRYEDKPSAALGRILIAAVRAELGPTLGLVEIREPTPEECERICMCYLGLDSPPSFGAKLGREVFDAVSAVMWPKESGK